jgi:hypothetical protein
MHATRTVALMMLPVSRPRSSNTPCMLPCAQRDIERRGAQVTQDPTCVEGSGSRA